MTVTRRAPRTAAPDRRARRATLAGLLAAPLLLAGCTGTSAVDAGGSGDYEFGRLATGPDGLFAAAERAPAPELRGETLQGEPLDVGALRGKVVVLNFWADWCAPCRAEARFLKAVSKQTEAQGVRFVGINVKDDRNAAKTFERTLGIDYPSLYDQPGVLLTRFRKVVPQTPPSTLLLDRSGRVAGIFHGGVTEEELSGPVHALAAEPA